MHIFEISKGEVVTVDNLHKSMRSGTGMKKADVLKPGSRGGHIIGTTKSGKPIYGPRLEVHGHEDEGKDWTEEDHADAAEHHRKHARNLRSKGKYDEAGHHEERARHHEHEASEHRKKKIAKEEGVHPKDLHQHLHSRLQAARDTMDHVGKMHASTAEARKNKKYADAEHVASDVQRQMARLRHYEASAETPFYRSTKKSVQRKIEHEEYTTPGEEHSEGTTQGETELGLRRQNSSTRVGKKTVERRNNNPKSAPERGEESPKLYVLGEAQTEKDADKEHVPEQPNYGGPGQIRNVKPTKSKNSKFKQIFKGVDDESDNGAVHSFDDQDMTLKKKNRDISKKQRKEFDKRKTKRSQSVEKEDNTSDDPAVLKASDMDARKGVVELDFSMEKGDVDSDAAKELDAYMHNDSEIHHSHILPIRRNLMKKLKTGSYKHDKAPDLWRYAVDKAAKQYHNEFGRSDASWRHTFNLDTRNALARHLANRFHSEAKRGEHDHLVKGLFDFMKQPKANPTAAVQQLGSRYTGPGKTSPIVRVPAPKPPAASKPRTEGTSSSTTGPTGKPLFTMAHLQAAKQALAGQQGKKKASLGKDETDLSDLASLGGPSALMKSIAVLALNAGTQQVAEEQAYYDGGMEDRTYGEFRSLLRSLPPKMWAFLKRVADKSIKPQVAIRHIAECIGEISKSVTVYKNEIEVVDADMAPHLADVMSEAVKAAVKEQKDLVKKNCPTHAFPLGGRPYSMPTFSTPLQPGMLRNTPNACNCFDKPIHKARLAKRACEILYEKAASDRRINNAVELLGIDMGAMRIFADTVV